MNLKSTIKSTKNAVEKEIINDPDTFNNNKNKNVQQESYKNNNDNNQLIPISINKNIKSAFKKALDNYGIDIMNPNDFIDIVYLYLSKEHKLNQKEMEEYRWKIENFVKTFIYFLVNWKFSLLEQTFDISENIIKILLKKQLCKCNYLKLNSIEEYKTKDKLQEKNYFIIFNVIKSIEYKYDVNIVGISSYKKQGMNCVYSFEQKFHWFIKFIDYIIVSYLSDNRITPFSQFFNNLSLKEEITKFDMERDFDLVHFYSSMNEETFIKKIIYVVENVIYHLIAKN